MFWRKKTVAEAMPKLPLSELRKRARILIVDDDEAAFPHKLLQKEGYNVTYWKSIQSLRELEGGEYDIIVLDIHGIADPKISETGGLGILSHIKRYNPAQIVVAYSGQKYDLRHAEFWKTADDYLAKPSSLLDCKQKIDTLLQQRFTPTYYAEVMRRLLHEQGVPEGRIAKLETMIVKQKDKPTSITVEDISKCVGVAKDAAGVLSVIASVILRLMSHGHHP